MKIAVLSGKGGAGKTLVAVNLARVIAGATYVDLDTEEPNGSLFMKPTDVVSSNVAVTLPKWNRELCTGCKKCVDFCAFNALAYVKSGMLIFDEICHSCGGCAMVCPEGAFTERQRIIGSVEVGHRGDTKVVSGALNMGEVSGIPIIKAALERVKDDADVVLDCPPGSACPVMESLKGADYCVLVAEPTIFGVDNLDMVYNLAKIFNKQVGVVLNKCVDGTNIARDYALSHGIPILGAIPWDMELGSLSSNGEIAVEKSAKYRTLFEGIRDSIVSEVAL